MTIQHGLDMSLTVQPYSQGTVAAQHVNAAGQKSLTNRRETLVSWSVAGLMLCRKQHLAAVAAMLIDGELCGRLVSAS
jgi:hypothetical protein